MPHGGLNILIPSIPKRYEITRTMIEDMLWNPALGAKVILGEHLDAFQSAELKRAWLTPNVMDCSGLGSSKSHRMWIVCNLRCILMPDHWCLVYYQFFEAGQRVFWSHYARCAMNSRLFATQIGNLDAKGETGGKATRKGQSTWTVYFKNTSKVEMPAGGFDRDSISQAGTNTNDIYMDEWTKVMGTGSEGIEKQILGRSRRPTFNKHHPLWANKIYFLATPEDTMHPAYTRYLTFEREVASGNPDFVVIRRSYKDFSNLRATSAHSFKEEYRDNRMISNLRKGLTLSAFMQEALGIWNRNGKGWYTQELMDRCYSIGAKRGIPPLIMPEQDPGYGDKKRMFWVKWFAGVDPAPGQTSKAADGALVALRAEPKNSQAPTCEVTDWNVDFVWGYKIRRADLTQWSALIHRKNMQFHFDGICMDSQGGGQWLQPELAKDKQKIRGQSVTVQPIASLEEEATAPINSQFILMMFRKTEGRIGNAWSTMRLSHPSNLVDTAHCEFLKAIDNGVVGFPPKLENRDKSLQWSDERLHANQMIDLTASQMMRILVKTAPDGKFFHNTFNAREFGSRGRKDFAYAAMYAFTAFFAWLKSNDNGLFGSKTEDRVHCGSSRNSGQLVGSRPEDMAIINRMGSQMMNPRSMIGGFGN
jgi:hypothetical protein